MHATFLLLVGFVLWKYYQERGSWSAALLGLGFVLLLFGIVVLHELGHALAARRYGIKTKDITLLPIGGLARLERIPEDPKQELVVALAGPAVNIALALVFFLILLVQAGFAAASNMRGIGQNLFVSLFWVNVFLAGFNLLPAFPMDGGRVLRALLALRINRVRATEIAASVGQIMAVIFAIWGLQSNPMLVLIALFVWLGAEAEAQQARTSAFLRGIPVKSLMATEFKSVETTTRLDQLAPELVSGFQTEFPVLEGERLVGFIGLNDIIRGLTASGGHALVSEFMSPEFPTAHPDEPLQSALARWNVEETPALAVVLEHALIGIVTRANVGEHVMIRSAMASRN